MKTVLIITRLYYRANTRVERLAKYLPQFGWHPIILTPPLLENPDPQLTIIETPYRDGLRFYKRLFRFNPTEGLGSQIRGRLGITSKKSFIDFLLTRGGEIINYPDSDKGWKPPALKASHELWRNEHIDAIITSSSPVTSHLIASKLRIKYKIPWIADFRDLWSQNHDYQYSPLRRMFDRRLEVKTLSKADALVTVSEPWAEKLRALHQGKPVYAITHGFDPEEVNIPPVSLTSKFTITYTGSIYTGKQDPTKLFGALRDLLSAGTVKPDDVEVRFYGTGVAWLDKEINRYGLKNVVKHYERVPKEVALEKQRESQLLLLLDWEDTEEKGVYTGKTFEYLGARRPILATGGSNDDVIDSLLSETKAGIHATDVADVKKALVKLYQEYKLKGKVVYNGIESRINKYSHREMARKFSAILNQLV